MRPRSFLRANSPGRATPKFALEKRLTLEDDANPHFAVKKTACSLQHCVRRTCLSFWWAPSVSQHESDSQTVHSLRYFSPSTAEGVDHRLRRPTHSIDLPRCSATASSVLHIKRCSHTLLFVMVPLLSGRVPFRPRVCPFRVHVVCASVSRPELGDRDNSAILLLTAARRA